MLTARKKVFTSATTFLVGVVALHLYPNLILATNMQNCTVSTSCTLGEFLYDDSYNPDTSATCSLNTKYPDGSNHITSQNLTTTADAWYGYTFTTPTTEGYYRGEICCDVEGEPLCIDKSFSAVAAVSGSSLTTTDIANSVWSSSSRTLTGFNNLVADIWSFATRGLTTGDNINIFSSTDVTTIKSEVSDTRLLLEKIVNKPIIENSLEEFQDFDLIGRVRDGQKATDEIYLNMILADSSISKIIKSWSTLSVSDAQKEISNIKEIVGEESDSSSTDTLFGRVNFLRDTFGYKEADSLYESILAFKDSLNFTQTSLFVSGKSDAATKKELSSGSVYLTSGEKSLSLINKRLKETEGLSSLIETNLDQTKKVLGAWNETTTTEKSNLIASIKKSVLSLNRIPKINGVLTSIYGDIMGDKKMKNEVLSLRGILFANKKYLASGNSNLLLANWLEEGSLVIKTLITNPSDLVSQDVPLKYYLPNELKREDIMETDAGLTVKYDTEKDQFYVDGNFTLRPGETKTLKVRVEDVWIINTDEIDALKAQADVLVKLLEGSSYYAQGITLKSDIDVSLAKIKGLVKEGVTPEDKIKTYREVKLELAAIQDKINKLKDMVSLADSSGSILGFVGGSQAIGVWGIVVAIVAGFVATTAYMRQLLGKTKPAKVKVVSKVNAFDKIAVFLVLATISGLVSSIGVKKFIVPNAIARESSNVTSKVVLGVNTIDYKSLKAVQLVSLDGVIKTYQEERSDVVLSLVDSKTGAILIERQEKRSRVVVNGSEVWVDNEHLLEI